MGWVGLVDLPKITRWPAGCQGREKWKQSIGAAPTKSPPIHMRHGKRHILAEACRQASRDASKSMPESQWSSFSVPWLDIDTFDAMSQH